MMLISRSSLALRVGSRAFSSSRPSASDLAKLTLIGRLGKAPETRTTKTDKEYVTYTVATNNYPPVSPNADGTRPSHTTSWHTIFSFSTTSNTYLRTIPKGAHVYVEAGYELREADPDAQAGSPNAQRQIFLRHENIRVLKYPSEHKGEEEH
ncbi:hypothetical protein BJ322DRAFT_329097 [Thelephora terrestris]|uniref:Nucleic acid-binding protein n=1 Tax=Thelephora terrestris TaxID=56493 RepID=A0A9P6H8D7_9AGAM|nr:hypothetical protein BJ322DRAFT_329097 [Thelephora terrestris]